MEKKAQRKPLTELYETGHFAEDRTEWQEELQRHCEEVYTDMVGTKEVQETRIEYFLQGNQQFTEDGGNAEITGDLALQARAKLSENTLRVRKLSLNCLFAVRNNNKLVLQARVKLSENKFNGPEDVIVSEMIQRLPMEKIYTITRCFQERCLRKPDAAPTKGIRSYRATALTSVMSKVVRIMYPPPLGKRKGA